MWMHTEEMVKQWCDWQKGNMNVRIWAKEAEEELDCIGLEFLCPNQQECSLRGISTQVKEMCNDMVW
jgi:hypothetical protein